MTLLGKLLKIISLKWQISPASQVEEQELIFLENTMKGLNAFVILETFAGKKSLLFGIVKSFNKGQKTNPKGQLHDSDTSIARDLFVTTEIPVLAFFFSSSFSECTCETFYFNIGC